MRSYASNKDMVFDELKWQGTFLFLLIHEASIQLPHLLMLLVFCEGVGVKKRNFEILERIMRNEF